MRYKIQNTQETKSSAAKPQRGLTLVASHSYGW